MTIGKSYRHICKDYIIITSPVITGDSLLVLLHIGVGPQELCEGSVVVDQLRVAAHLRHPSLVHHHNQVTLREEPDPVGHQDTHLGQGGRARRRLQPQGSLSLSLLF